MGVIVAHSKTDVQIRVRRGEQQVNPDASTVIIPMSGPHARLGTPADVERYAVLVIGQATDGTVTAQVAIIIDRTVVQSRRNNPGTTTARIP